jgi:hypothetical protein
MVVSDHDGVDAVCSEDPRDGAQRHPGRAGHEATVHDVLHAGAGKVWLWFEAGHVGFSRSP